MDLVNEWSLTVLNFLLHWVLPSSLLILIGLCAARLLRKRGAAFQSVIYRTTLVTALVCPLATWCLSQTELSGWAFRLAAAQPVQKPSLEQDSAQTAKPSKQDGAPIEQLLRASTLSQSDLEEAGVEYLKSQLRYALDRTLFPPAGKGGDDPGVLRAALSSVFDTHSIMNKLEAQPDVFLKVVKRMETWSPDYPADYDPGWKYTHRLDAAAIVRQVTDAREKLLPALRKKATLLNDPRYRDALVKLKETEKQRYADPASLSRREHFDVLARERTKLHMVEWELIPESRWHAKVGWRAENYFTDPRVIELCQAIEINDLERMRVLIDQGADVNASGKKNMTPLLWAFPDLKFERFEMLLEAGADPNIIAAASVKPQRHRFQPILNPHFPAFYNFTKGSSVNLLTYQAPDKRYWRAVLKHGGDVNQISPSKYHNSLLHTVLDNGMHHWERDEVMSAVKALVKKGANLKTVSYHGQPPLSKAIENKQYEIAIFLVQSGAELNGQQFNRTSQKRKSPAQLVEDMKPFGYYADNPERSEKLNAELRKAATERGVRQQALYDAMDKQGAIFEADKISADRGLAKSRASILRDIKSRVQREQSRVPGSSSYHYRGPIYKSTDIEDPARRREFSKYYSHVSPDFSKPSRAVNFSIKHVSADQLKNVKTSLPEFAAIGDRNESGILIAPSLSGHSDWLTVHGGVWEDYLRHLAIKKCNLLDRTSADFPKLAKKMPEGFYFVEVANDKRRNELLIPAKYLRDEAVRRKSGLEAFGEIWKIIDDYKMRSFIGSSQQTGTLLAGINKQLNSQFPDAKFRFYIEHLTAANLDANGVLRCTFEFSEAETKLKYTASCIRNVWADDSTPRKRLTELKKESDAFLKTFQAGATFESKWRKAQEEFRALDKLTNDYQLSVEITRQ